MKHIKATKFNFGAFGATQIPRPTKDRCDSKLAVNKSII